MKNLMDAITFEVALDQLNGYYEPIMGPNSVAKVEVFTNYDFLRQLSKYFYQYVNSK